MWMGLMAVGSIWIGSFNSIRTSDVQEVIGTSEAKWLPLLGSGMLLFLYVLIKYLDVMTFITLYLTGMGMIALFRIKSLIGAWITHRFQQGFKLSFSFEDRVIVNAHFGWMHVLFSVTTLVCGVYYWLGKSWILNNLFGQVLAITSIEIVRLESMTTAFVLLSGLFFYDIFWVFGTNVMVTVAKGIEAPIKLVIPGPSGYSMLGLGDIVVPGFVIALCLRYDHFRFKQEKTQTFVKPYFYSTIVGYILGLVTAMLMVQVFETAQPALLYLSPACILSPILCSLYLRDWQSFWAFKDTISP
ncbi:minor histocompatibility antigen H13-like protein [Gorgonomyces haynaldii]|nr:minor histocompatibility antigen H13-like protein [Gorgonomyces haynaldii]